MCERSNQNLRCGSPVGLQNHYQQRADLEEAQQRALFELNGGKQALSLVAQRRTMPRSEGSSLLKSSAKILEGLQQSHFLHLQRALQAGFHSGSG